MDRDDILRAAQAAYADVTSRIAAMLRAQPTLDIRIGGGSVWTLREAGVHLVAWSNVYRDIAAGATSSVASLDRAYVAATSEALHADIAESDPGKVADLVEAAAAAYLRQTAGWSGERRTSWHAGLTLDLADVTTILTADALLHGYDIACTLGMPWPVDGGLALMIIGSYAPLLGRILDPVRTAGHTAAYGIELRGGPSLVTRFSGGKLSLEGPGTQVDCRISADPAAFLLVFSGRMSRWPAVALGLVSADGPRPELALGFQDLFVFP